MTFCTRTARRQFDVDALRVAQVVDEPLAGADGSSPRHRSRSGRCHLAVRSCTPLERTVKQPSSMYQIASDSGVSALR